LAGSAASSTRWASATLVELEPMSSETEMYPIVLSLLSSADAPGSSGLTTRTTCGTAFRFLTVALIAAVLDESPSEPLGSRRATGMLPYACCGR
jgi:hypothetical protein